MTDPLERLHIAAPCTQDWEGMSGDDRARHCAECQLDVFNLSEMPRAEAREVLADAEGRVCVRYRRDSTGAVLHREPPATAVRPNRVLAAFARMAGALCLGFVALAGCARQRDEVSSDPLPTRQPTPQQQPPDVECVMGEVVMGRIRVEPEPATEPEDEPR